VEELICADRTQCCPTHHSTWTGAIKPRQPVNSNVIFLIDFLLAAGKQLSAIDKPANQLSIAQSAVFYLAIAQ
jgi:hypothetical protein